MLDDINFIESICDPESSLFFIAVPKTGSTYTDFYFSSVKGTRYFSGGHCVCQKKPISYYDRAWNVSCCNNPYIQTCVPFSIVRNPFDLLVSMYIYGFPYYPPGMPKTTCAVRSGKEPYWPFSSFEDFCIKYCDPDFPWIVPPQKRFLFFQLFDDSGKCVPKFLIRQERLSEGLDILRKVLKVDPSVVLENRRSRTPRHDYKKFYDKRLFSMVAEKCANELTAFGYNFEGNDGRIFIDTESIYYNHNENTFEKSDFNSQLSMNDLKPDYELMQKDFHPYKLRSYSCLDLFSGIYSNLYLYTRKKMNIPIEDLGHQSR